ncbi:hypothetical protein BLNAU_12978 [Blattamonas nauphoetae]|uniref:Trichohyalin n=1 Tax=Blattamonas nauphoetae TaxID=2049346 RepID=A0ABQ9XL66_9EUKA|nr:hypothetical protein BLNAU_12978 [Blattamonas nauphoetae]
MDNSDSDTDIKINQLEEELNSIQRQNQLFQQQLRTINPSPYKNNHNTSYSSDYQTHHRKKSRSDRQLDAIERELRDFREGTTEMQTALQQRIQLIQQQQQNEIQSRERYLSIQEQKRKEKEQRRKKEKEKREKDRIAQKSREERMQQEWENENKRIEERNRRIEAEHMREMERINSQILETIRLQQERQSSNSSDLMLLRILSDFRSENDKTRQTLENELRKTQNQLESLHNRNDRHAPLRSSAFVEAFPSEVKSTTSSTTKFPAAPVEHMSPPQSPLDTDDEMTAIDRSLRNGHWGVDDVDRPLAFEAAQPEPISHEYQPTDSTQSNSALYYEKHLEAQQRRDHARQQRMEAEHSIREEELDAREQLRLTRQKEASTRRQNELEFQRTIERERQQQRDLDETQRRRQLEERAIRENEHRRQMEEERHSRWKAEQTLQDEARQSRKEEAERREQRRLMELERIRKEEEDERNRREERNRQYDLDQAARTRERRREEEERRDAEQKREEEYRRQRDEKRRERQEKEETRQRRRREEEDIRRHEQYQQEAEAQARTERLRRVEEETRQRKRQQLIEMNETMLREKAFRDDMEDDEEKERELREREETRRRSDVKAEQRKEWRRGVYRQDLERREAFRQREEERTRDFLDHERQTDDVLTQINNEEVAMIQTRNGTLSQHTTQSISNEAEEKERQEQERKRKEQERNEKINAFMAQVKFQKESEANRRLESQQISVNDEEEQDNKSNQSEDESSIDYDFADGPESEQNITRIPTRSPQTDETGRMTLVYHVHSQPTDEPLQTHTHTHAAPSGTDSPASNTQRASQNEHISSSSWRDTRQSAFVPQERSREEDDFGTSQYSFQPRHDFDQSQWRITADRGWGDLPPEPAPLAAPKQTERMPLRRKGTTSTRWTNEDRRNMLLQIKDKTKPG